ncbi:MAG: glutathione S-transferase [Pseudomonadales bacterium]|nr:glutathione S-transferase [Pseudomonadales bacterium]
MNTYHIYAGPGSPYSHKVRAYFRYKRIAHTWLVPMGGFDGEATLGSDNDADTPLSRAGKGVVPVIEYPDGSYKSDSTPVMLELDALHPERGIVPPSPAIAFIAQLIEDLADEYLPLPMFYFRWTDDADWCGRRQMTGWNGALNDARLTELANKFLSRQQGQLKAMPRDVMMDQYLAILDALERLFSERFFLFGDRPSLAEFGLYGQLTQYIADPTVSAVLRERAVRTFQWTHFIDDLSGVEPGGWLEPSACLTESVAGLISALAPMYFVMASRMLEATSGQDLTAAVNGPAYRAKCYLNLKQQLSDLTEGERKLLEPFLQQAGCWDALQFAAGEEDRVVAIVPG